MLPLLLFAFATCSTAASLVVVPLKGCSVATSNPEEFGSYARSTMHFAEVSVGSPGQMFRLLFDTGSSALWVPSSDCSQPPCLLHRRYQPTRSNTSRITKAAKEGQGVATSFATGELVGLPWHDLFCIGGHDRQGCAELDLLAAFEASNYPFIQMPFDGILGLGLSAQDEIGPAKALAQQSSLSVFAVRLGEPRCKQPSGEAVFASDFSQLPLARMSTGQVDWAPLAPEAEETGYWLLSVLSVSVGDEVVQNCSGSGSTASGCVAAVDTGTGYMMGPTEGVDSMMALLKVKEDCSNFFGLPQMHFKFKGSHGRTVSLILGPEDYIDQTDGVCDLQLTDIDLPPSKPQLWVLGQPILRKFVSVYDQFQRQVGFARAAEAGSPVATSSTGFTVARERKLRLHRATASSISSKPFASTMSEDSSSVGAQSELP